jgi:two-component system response regulator MprA
MRLLIVEDHEELAMTLATGLRREGMAVDVAHDGESGVQRAVLDDYDVIVLDRDLPVVHGDLVCQRLVAAGCRARVLMLTAAGTIEDRVDGLTLGADDYLPKPFALDELLARLRALLRRIPGSGGALSYADVSVEPLGHRAWRAELRLDLTRTEFALLELFVRSAERVLSRSEILVAVWGYDFGPTSNSLEVYVGYLRRKLEDGGLPRLIHTVRGVGYVMRHEP